MATQKNIQRNKIMLADAQLKRLGIAEIHKAKRQDERNKQGEEKVVRVVLAED